MTIYVIIAPPGSTLSDESVSQKFADWLSIIPNHSWAIATTLPTCADIRDNLRVDDSSVSCVVIKVTDYNGYAKRELWQKLESWERNNG